MLISLLLISLITYWFYPSYNRSIEYRDPEIYGMVSSEKTARQIAEAIWLQVYGDIIYKSTPFKATLKDSVWTITGTLHSDNGGTPYMELSMKDARVIKVVHYK